MSRLEELIKELCPDGVDYKKLGEVAPISRGKRLVREQLSERGLYPVYQNSLIPLGYYNQCNRTAGKVFVIGAGAAGDIGYCDVDFWAADDCYTFDCQNVLINRFLYFVLTNQETFIASKVRRSSVPRLSREELERVLVPVPPIEVQIEVVRVLDSFTALTAELTAELTARKKQYEYYRNSILSFKKSGINNE